MDEAGLGECADRTSPTASEQIAWLVFGVNLAPETFGKQIIFLSNLIEQVVSPSNTQ